MKVPLTHARELFRQRGILRASEAIASGIHPRTLYAMRDSGEVHTLTRGVYRLANLPSLSNPDLAAVATRAPHAVVCLVSALAFHGMTAQVPHEIDLAIARSARAPVIEYPPIRVYRFTGAAFTAGVEERQIDHVSVRVYSAEKTLADCFKFRNRIGLNIAIEALRAYRERRLKDFDKVLHFARICRVERVMRPYLEASV